jgi:hypothetical protein
MKPWQIFLVGMGGAAALFSFHAYESALAGLVAIAIVSAVVFGFCVRPRKEVFYLRATIQVPDPDYAVTMEHHQLAVRVELARLWLLFIATFTAVAFLLVTFASGTTWRISLIDSTLVNWLNLGPYPVLLSFRLVVIAVCGLLIAWVSERWVLRDASVCSPPSCIGTRSESCTASKTPLANTTAARVFRSVLLAQPDCARLCSIGLVASPEQNCDVLLVSSSGNSRDRSDGFG